MHEGVRLVNSQSTPPDAQMSARPLSRDVAGTIPVFSSAALFKGTQEIAIEHQGSIYRLRITRQGKLILNK
jgi:hemin uptake protein HemP